MEAAEWWGLVVFGDAGELELSDAGRVWFEAEEAGFAPPRGRSFVSERRKTEPTFSIGNNYGTINVARTIKSNDAAERLRGPSDRELLEALSAILQQDDIPW